MVFGSDQDPQKKLQSEREKQEKKITEELKSLNMDQKLQESTMTQRGHAAAAVAAAKKETPTHRQTNTTNGTSSTASTAPAEKQPGPFAKLQQHVQMAQKGYEQLVHAIIRPPRAKYQPTDRHLGDKSFTFLGTKFERQDIELLTERGLKIVCSHWKQSESESSPPPAEADGSNGQKQNTVVVYMHGNASARVESFQQLSFLLSLGTSVFAFDFAGSGLSDGEYVSLGYYEREDLATVIAHLRSSMGSDVRIALWGRSMGAATALMYASREITMPHQNVSCMILDSSFCDLVKLAEEMVDKAREQGIVVPNVVVSVALTAIRWSVQKKAQFDIRDISPYSHSPDIKIPALFVCGKQDDFIKPHHSEMICEPYGGPKNLLMVEGDHNALRPPLVFDCAKLFLTRNLLQTEDCVLDVPAGLNLQNAPWQHRRNPRVYQRHEPPLQIPTSPTSHSTSGGTPDPSKQFSQSTSNVSTTSSIDVTQIGMTKERQDDIQSSVVTMLGGEEKSC